MSAKIKVVLTLPSLQSAALPCSYKIFPSASIFTSPDPFKMIFRNLGFLQLLTCQFFVSTGLWPVIGQCGSAVALWPHSDYPETSLSTAVVGSCVGAACHKGWRNYHKTISQRCVQRSCQERTESRSDSGSDCTRRSEGSGRQTETEEDFDAVRLWPTYFEDRRRNRSQSFIRHLDVGLVSNLTTQSKARR